MKGDEFFRLIARKPPFSKLHPRVAGFFKEYLSEEKVIIFRDSFILNTHFPPYPGPAFDNLVNHFSRIGEAIERRLYSVTLAVTNRCGYNCWHCYNAGRNQRDIPLALLKEIIAELQNMGVVMVTLSGGEPLLRDDLEEIASAFDDRTCLTLNTTGSGLTPERAHRLRDSGLFAVGVSLDSDKPEEHDRSRGIKGAFDTALAAIDCAQKAGLYPYFISVATREFLKPERFGPFIHFASGSGALEVHLIEPCATGKLAGKSDVLLTKADRQRILDYQKKISLDENLPVLSTFTYLESSKAFGCGAGLTHLYIDGSGELCPCNLVPLSFGNITKEPLQVIFDRMSEYFRKPRSSCAGQVLAKHINSERLPASLEDSIKICERHLPSSHRLPRFFRIRTAAKGDVGIKELRSAYDRIHEYYDEFWLKEAAAPVEDLLDRLSLTGRERVFEAGCGTGFATVLMANKMDKDGRIMAADLSGGMLAEARRRARSIPAGDITFMEGDALKIMGAEGPFDIIFSSWVLGYIPLKPFFTAAVRALKNGGRLAFVVHRENSPEEPLEIFQELVAESPSILRKSVRFDFPRDTVHLERELSSAGLGIEDIREGKVIFRYDCPELVLEHLLKSGAGTAFYDAVDPKRRDSLEKKFLERLAARERSSKDYKVVHDYLSCVAGKSADN